MKDSEKIGRLPTKAQLKEFHLGELRKAEEVIDKQVDVLQARKTKLLEAAAVPTKSGRPRPWVKHQLLSMDRELARLNGRKERVKKLRGDVERQ